MTFISQSTHLLKSITAYPTALKIINHFPIAQSSTDERR